MRTDVRDRFGTPLEKRFSKKQITKMLKKSGLENIKFSDNEPFLVCSWNKKKGFKLMCGIVGVITNKENRYDMVDTI